MLIKNNFGNGKCAYSYALLLKKLNLHFKAQFYRFYFQLPISTAPMNLNIEIRNV
jgi:hypothetical protein